MIVEHTNEKNQRMKQIIKKHDLVRYNYEFQRRTQAF